VDYGLTGALFEVNRVDCVGLIWVQNRAKVAQFRRTRGWVGRAGNGGIFGLEMLNITGAKCDENRGLESEGIGFIILYACIADSVSKGRFKWTDLTPVILWQIGQRHIGGKTDRVGMIGFTAYHPSHTTGRAVFRIRRLNLGYCRSAAPAQAQGL